MESLNWPGGATAVAIEARQWIGAAGLQFGAEDIGFTVHSTSVAKRPRAIIGLMNAS